MSLQDASKAELLHHIDNLETANSNLELRIRVLENGRAIDSLLQGAQGATHCIRSLLAMREGITDDLLRGVLVFLDAAIAKAKGSDRDLPELPATDDLPGLTVDIATVGLHELVEALEESLKLQAHYARLLNMHDGGERIGFADAGQWIARLRATRKTKG